MEQKPDDLTAPQGGKSNNRKKKTYIDPNTIPMKEGDILKLNPEYTIAETEWKDVEGIVHDQSTLSAAQLGIARKYKLVVPHDLAIMMANATDEECRQAIIRLKYRYASTLLDPFGLDPVDVEYAARKYAGIASMADIDIIKTKVPDKYQRYLDFKHGAAFITKSYNRQKKS